MQGLLLRPTGQEDTKHPLFLTFPGELEREFIQSQLRPMLGQMRRNHAFATVLSLALIPIMELATPQDGAAFPVRPLMIGLALAQATFLALTWTAWLRTHDRIRVWVSFALRVAYCVSLCHPGQGQGRHAHVLPHRERSDETQH